MAGVDDIPGGTFVPEAFESSSCGALDKIESYWGTVRRGRLVPQRIEIDPRGLNGVLAHAFVLERITQGLARFRISGSQLTEFAGTELRGVPISALFTADAHEELSDVVSAVFDDPSIVRLKVTSPAGFGRPALEGYMVLLPLRSDLGEISRVLGGFEMNGEFGRAQRRLAIDSQSRRGLTGFTGEDPIPFPSNSKNRRPELATCNTAPIATRSGSNEPFLRLVANNS